MNTGSLDERKMLSDVSRIAKALERIADSLEPVVEGESDDTYRALVDAEKRVLALEEDVAERDSRIAELGKA